MEQRITDFFASETMPENCAARIEAALTQPVKCRRSPLRPLAAAAAMVLLVLFLGNIPAVRAYAGELYEEFVHAIAPELADQMGEVEEDHVVLLNGFHATRGDATGNDLDVWIYTEEEVDFCEVRDGRLYFIANGENLDITDLCSAEKAFVYAVADTDGRVAYLAVGGTPENYGQYSYYPVVSDFLYDFEGYTHTGEAIPEWVKDAKHQIQGLIG